MFGWFRRLQMWWRENGRRARERYIRERELPKVEAILNDIATSKSRGKETIPAELVRNVFSGFDDKEKQHIEDELIRGRDQIDRAEFNYYFAQLLCGKYNDVLHEE